jgi:glycerophosphoryl diester phosphodiesterase/membrane-associated phospholipid phosphatase
VEGTLTRSRRITTEQRLTLIGVLLTLFALLFRLVRGHKTDRFDVAVTTAFQTRKNPRFSRLMHLVSWPGFPPQSRIIPWLLPLAWAISGKWLEAVIQGMGWGTGVLSAIFKRTMKRPRPDKATFYFAPARIGGTSFPSGHVINYIGVYGTAAYLASFNISSRPIRRGVQLTAGSLLALVGPSRVYLGHHWTTDVTASYLLGSSYVLGLGGVYGALKDRERSLLERHAATTDPYAFEIVGHGGAGSFYPGNGRRAILASLQFDIDRIEFDLRLAGDGELVLVHDEALETAPKQRTPVNKLTTDTIRELLPDLLTFDEVVELVAGRASFMIDVKLGGYENELIAAINRHGLADTAVISCTDPRAIRKLRRALPTMPIYFSTGYRLLGAILHGGKPVTPEILQDFAPGPLLAIMRMCGASGISLHYHLVAPDVVQFFHDHGYQVYAWTVDRPMMMKRMHAARVDGIISNRPDLVVDVVRPSR